jgi:TolB-like protein/Tfp pilus assembly protein PilF
VHRARQAVAPHQGRLVTASDTGLVLSFHHARRALHAAADLHRLIELASADQPGVPRLWLRAAIHAGPAAGAAAQLPEPARQRLDRLAARANAGDTVLSAAARENLAEGLDATLEDLGEQDDDDVADPTPSEAPDGLTRVYRVLGAGGHPQRPALPEPSAELRAVIAVLPFDSGERGHERLAIGELIAGGVIHRLSRARHLRVITRLSTQALRGRATTAAQLQQHLGATHVLSGDFAGPGGRLAIRYELRALADDSVVRTGQLSATVADLLQLDCEPMGELAQQVHDALFEEAGQAVLSRPLPTLQSFALLLGGIQLLHRSSRRDFAASFGVLEHLVRQYPRCVEPLIWQAKWYALRAVQGLTADREAEARAALDCIARALDVEPGNSFALAMQGFVHCVLSRDQDAADAALHRAVALNPNESLGHLFQGMTLGLQGRLDEGIAAFGSATATSPLDPACYMYDSIGAYLHVAAGHQAHAIALARRSLRLNREHAHSWRALTIAQVELGRLDEARASLQELLRVQPGLTQRSYLAGTGADARNRSRFAEALGRAGLPA